jgi:hypothetical protein
VRVTGIVTQMLPQAPDVHIDHPLIPVEVIPPDPLQELPPGKEKTRPGASENAANRSNSRADNTTGRPATVTSRRSTSSDRPGKTRRRCSGADVLVRRSTALTRAVTSRGLNGLVM